MKHEDKELLLQDLCARLPYGVIIEHEGNLSKLDTIFMCDSISISSTSIDKKLSYNLDLDEVKPYLFPLSSMTEEQKKEFPFESSLLNAFINGYISLFEDEELTIGDIVRMLEWLNKNHFDYRGLIPMDLAIDCTNLGIY